MASTRPVEITNNLNPAFCGEIIRRCLYKYQTMTKKHLPVTLSYLILPIVLHKDTREAIGNTRKEMHPWLQENPQVKVDFAKRVKGFEQITNETLIFLTQDLSIQMYTGSIEILHFRPKPITIFSSEEVKDCMRKAERVGQWFARAGDPASIYIMWGIRP
jgi:hypothetical protein